MEDSKPFKHAEFFMDPAYKSSLVMRSTDLIAPKTRYYDLDLEEQRGNEKTTLANTPVKSSRRRRACSLCCCSCFYITLILLISLGIVILKLVPKNPVVYLGDLHLTEFVYNDSSSAAGPQIQAEFAIAVNVTNRNSHADVIYNEIDVNLFFKDQAIGAIPAQTLEQKRKMTSALMFQLPRTVTAIQNKADADALKQEAEASNVQVELRGPVRGKHKVLGLKVKSFDIAVHCVYNLNPGGGSQGSQPQQISHSCYYDA